MANLKITSTDYDELIDYLDGRQFVTIGNNTRLAHTRIGVVSVILHSTAVVEIDELGNVTLDTGGWETVTAKDRINAFLSGSEMSTNPRLVTRKGVLYLSLTGEHGPTEVEHEFHDGMTIDRFGHLGRVLREVAA